MSMFWELPEKIYCKSKQFCQIYNFKFYITSAMPWLYRCLHFGGGALSFDVLPDLHESSCFFLNQIFLPKLNAVLLRLNPQWHWTKS